jgi:hypothetical protein
MSGAVQVGQLVINMAADVASLKTSLAEGVRESKAGAEKMAAELSAIKKGFQDAVAPLQDLTVKVGSLESNLARAQSSALSLGKGLILGAAAGMSIDAIAKKINGVIESMAALKTASEKTGSSVENLSKLSFAAKQSGSDLDSVASALAKMSKGMAGADDETKGAGRALAFLGISAKDSAGNLKDPAAMFVEIAKKLDGYTDGAGKAAIAQALFGKAGADMLPTLKLIGEQGDIVAKVTDAQATAARQYQRDLAKLDAQKNMVFKTIATALLPTMTDFAGAMLDVSKNTNLANGAVKDMAKDDGLTNWADEAAMGAARLVDVIAMIPRLLSAVTGSFKVVGADIKTISVMAENANPIKAAWKKLNGGDPLGEIRQAIEERNKVLADANQKYDELWNYEGNAMEKAMAKRIANRAKDRADRAKDEKGRTALNFSTVNDDSKGGPSLNSLIAGAQGELDSEKSVYEARVKMLDLYHTKFGTADDEFYTGRAAARADYIAAEAIAYAKETSLALDAQAKARKPEEVAAAKDKYAQLANAHRQFLESMSDAGGADAVNQEADQQKKYNEMITAMHEAGVASISSLDQQIAKQQEHNAEIGKTKEQIELAKQAQVDLATAQLQGDADYLRDGLAKWDLDARSRAAYQIRLSDLDEEIKRRRVLSGELAKGADLEAGAAAAAELDKYLDPEKAKEFGNALKGSLGAAANSMIALTSVMQKYGKEQDANEKARANAQILLKGNDKERAKGLEDLAQINAKSTKEQLGSYGNMASAAAGFFDEHSRGYQALTTISQVFHAAELAMTMAELVPKAISAVLTQGQGDPYTAFGRMAAMGAMVAGLGVAIGGMSGADTTAKDRQAAQGAGSILGDKDAKSESLKKSLDLIEKNTYQGLAISSSMLATLQSIDSNISSFAGHLLSSTDITNPDVGNLKAGAGSTNLAKADMVATGAEIGMMFGAPFIGALVGALASKIPGVQKLYTSIFGGKQSVSDSGFSMDATSLASILGNGAHAKQYADITTSGGWFSSDKHSEQSDPLSDAANRQFTGIITSLADSIKAAGGMLGLAGDDFTSKLNSFVVDIGHVSLKDLKGDELQKALESVFSKLGDDMAQYAVGGLQDLQQVGEGYLETLARVATEYQTIDLVFQSFGKTFGEVGLASLDARDRLVQLAGGLDKFTSQGEYFLTNFFSEQEQTAALKARVQPVLDQYGLQASGDGALRALRDFVVGLDTTTEAGAQAYATLMQYAPAVKQIADAEQHIYDERKGLQDKLDELTMTSAQLHEKERAAVDASNLVLYDRVAALQAEKDAATTLLGDVDNAFSVLQRVTKITTDALTARITAEKALSDAVKSTLASMKVQGAEMADRAAAQAQVKAALAIAKASGVLPDAAALQKPFSVLSQDAASMFSNQQDYLRDFYSTQRDIASLGDMADSSLSVDQMQLDSLNNMLKAAQHQIDILKGIDTSNLTIAQALAGFNSAVGSAQANPVVGATAAINGAYQQYLGRAPDAPGLEWWQNAAAGGAPVSQIVDGIKNSTEASLNTLYKDVLGRAPDAAGLNFWMKAYGPTMDAAEQADWMKAAQAELDGKRIPGFAGGGEHSGGWRIVGENGPELEATGPARIFNASQTSSLMSRLASPAANADALAAAVDRLNATVERQQVVIQQQGAALEQTQRNTKSMADTLQRLTRGTGALFVQSDTTTGN